MSETRRKLVVVGDTGTGKTSLLLSLAKGWFPVGWIPVVFEAFEQDIDVDGRQVTLAVCDTPGHEDYARLRPLTYPNAQVVAICYSVDKPESLRNVGEKWIKEVSHYCRGVPVVLVGCKKDLRMDIGVIEELRKTGQHTVTAEEGTAVAQNIGAKYYAECSGRTREGLDELLQHVACASLLYKSHKRSAKGGCLVV